MDLIIVESPGKIKNLRQYAGKGYQVKASVGHIRDLPHDDLGIDLEEGYAETYVVTKPDVVKDLKAAAKKAETIYLAADPDREGEAIAWHIQEILPKRDQKKLKRISFQEITKVAVRAALQRPGEIDLPLVEAQRARRVIDRLVGYQISPLLRRWGLRSDKGLSAGRVQTATLRIVTERERVRRHFIPQTYYTLHAQFEHTSIIFQAKMSDPARFEEVEVCQQALAQLQAAPAWWVADYRSESKNKKPAAPFTTSTMQQTASKQLRLPPKQSQAAAQELYEACLVTYIRTDSVHVAPEAQAAARQLIEQLYGTSYLPDEPPVYRSRAGAQEVHEAIRPTACRKTPQQVVDDPGDLSAKAQQLYGLIWQRFIASQMRPAQYQVITATLQAGADPDQALPFTFTTRSRQRSFEGFEKVYLEKEDEQDEGEDEESEEENAYLPPMQPGDKLHLHDLATQERQTKPPPRFTQASLIAQLERLDIGRPSTYATAVETVLARDYVALKKRQLVPTQLGEEVLALLVENFPALFSIDFTATMEELLDQIANGKVSRERILDAFYRTKLAPALEETLREIRMASETGQTCPDCGQALLIRQGKKGDFIGCAGYPNCTYTCRTEDIEQQKEIV